MKGINNLLPIEQEALKFLKKQKSAVSLKDIFKGLNKGSYRKLDIVLKELIALKLVGKRIQKYNKKTKGLYYFKSF